jgi:diacylglycerol kinase (ATP)
VGDQIVVLYNNISANGKGKKSALRLCNILEQKQIYYTSYENTWPLNLDEYKEVWVIGGDGTFNYFINKYKNLTIPVALFAGGSGNDYHWKIYGVTSLENQINHVLSCGTKAVDIGQCNSDLFANVIGLGFDGAVLKDMKLVRSIGGHLGYLAIVIKNIFTYKEKRLDITINNGTSFQKECMICIVSNSTRTGGGFMIAPNAKIDDGKLDFLHCGKMTLLQRLLYLSKVEKGKHIQMKQTNYNLVEKMSIKSETPIHYQLDGELLSAQNFEIKILPAHLNMKV